MGNGWVDSLDPPGPLARLVAIDPPVTSTPSLILIRWDDRLDTRATYSTDNTAGFLTRMSEGGP